MQRFPSFFASSSVKRSIRSSKLPRTCSALIWTSLRLLLSSNSKWPKNNSLWSIIWVSPLSSKLCIAKSLSAVPLIGVLSCSAGSSLRWLSSFKRLKWWTSTLGRLSREPSPRNASIDAAAMLPWPMAVVSRCGRMISTQAMCLSWLSLYKNCRNP